jgi:hypothetical protein
VRCERTYYLWGGVLAMGAAEGRVVRLRKYAGTYSVWSTRRLLPFDDIFRVAILISSLSVQCGLHAVWCGALHDLQRLKCITLTPRSSFLRYLALPSAALPASKVATKMKTDNFDGAQTEESDVQLYNINDPRRREGSLHAGTTCRGCN